MHDIHGKCTGAGVLGTIDGVGIGVASVGLASLTKACSRLDESGVSVARSSCGISLATVIFPAVRGVMRPLISFRAIENAEDELMTHICDTASR